MVTAPCQGLQLRVLALSLCKLLLSRPTARSIVRFTIATAPRALAHASPIGTPANLCPGKGSARVAELGLALTKMGNNVAGVPGKRIEVCRVRRCGRLVP